MTVQHGLWISVLVMAFGCAGTAPGPAGKVGPAMGRLADCPDSPNCVSSLAPASDAQHHVAALPLAVDRGLAMVWLRRSALELPGAELAAMGPDYLRVECKSRVFGFVDDLELSLDPEAPVVQVRSASRLGYGDMGVNRERVEALRLLLQRGETGGETSGQTEAGQP